MPKGVEHNKQIPIALACLLVLLRLAIGWHFYVEGSKKVKSLDVGKTTTSQPFSSKEFLRGSTGPLAETFHWQGDDPDRVALARLDGEGPALAEHYDKYFNGFVDYLGVGDDKVFRSQLALDPIERLELFAISRLAHDDLATFEQVEIEDVGRLSDLPENVVGSVYGVADWPLVEQL